MAKENSEKGCEKRMAKILSMLRDIDMKLNHIIERLKNSYSYLNSINSK